jgi:hypothetical protein
LLKRTKNSWLFARASLILANSFLPLSKALGVQKNMRPTDNLDNKIGFIISLLSGFSMLAVALSGQTQWLKYVTPLLLLWGLNCIWAYVKKKTIYSLYLPIASDAEIIWRILGLTVGILFIVISIGMYT